LNAPVELQAGTALRVLLAELIDYAGLFPPAGLAMGDAVRNYSSYLAGEDAWAVGRFVTPVARFGKFESALDALPPQPMPWHLTALLGNDWAADLRAIHDLNQRLEGRVLVDAVETKTAVVADIRKLAAVLPRNIAGYCEIDLSRSEAHIPVLKSNGLRAKIRTGGVTEDAFPAAQTIAEFLQCCARNQVAFKATAGLHHPVRCDHALTYEADAPRGTMHGFLNVFLAAAMAVQGAGVEEMSELLADRDSAHFTFTADAAHWNGHAFSADSLLQMRRDFALSFGSCSFEEPLADLRQLGLL
jgi:hypothetical protein